MEYFYEWCKRQRLNPKPNNEVYFVNEQILMKPEFILGENVFLDIIDDFVDEKYLEWCRLFSLSYGTIILVYRKDLPEIITVTRADIEKRFNVQLR